MKLHLHVVCLSNINSREVKSFRRLPHFAFFRFLVMLIYTNFPTQPLSIIAGLQIIFFSWKDRCPHQDTILVGQNKILVQYTKRKVEDALRRILTTEYHTVVFNLWIVFVSQHHFTVVTLQKYEQKESFCYSVILLPLHPASLRHKNPQICKIIHGMRAVGCKDRSIDLNMCICRNIRPTRTWF